MRLDVLDKDWKSWEVGYCYKFGRDIVVIVLLCLKKNICFILKEKIVS